MRESTGPRNVGVTSRLRLRGFDYTSAGIYFITCVTANRTPIFGAVEQSIYYPSPMGLVLMEEWKALECESVIIDCFQVMPDHFHGLISLLSDDSDKPTSLSSVIGRFKSLTSRKYWQLRDDGLCDDVGTTCWQGRFHDKIIRSERQYEELVLYMALNPHRWTQRSKSLGSSPARCDVL